MRLQEHPNLMALLDAVAWSEGTPQVPGSDDGYNVLVGGTLFDSYADHPRQHVQVQPRLWSTAAGRYQIIEATWDGMKKQLLLTDFSPVSQDLCAVNLVRDAGAITLIESGQFELAVARCSHLWASLPGAGYHQRENKLEVVRGFYERFGGTFA